MCAQLHDIKVEDILARRSELTSYVPAELADEDRANFVDSVHRSLDGLQANDEAESQEAFDEALNLFRKAGVIDGGAHRQRAISQRARDWAECIFQCGAYDPKCTFGCLIAGFDD